MQMSHIDYNLCHTVSGLACLHVKVRNALTIPQLVHVTCHGSSCHKSNSGVSHTLRYSAY